MNAQYYIKQATEAIEKAGLEIEKVQDLNGKVMKVEPMPKCEFYHGLGTFFKRSSYISFNKENRSHVEEAITTARKEFQERGKLLEHVHNQNFAAIENNKKVAKKVFDFMASMEISETYSIYDYKTPRHKSKDWVKKQSGFVSDVSRVIKINDGYEMAASSLNSSIDDYEKEYKILIAAITAKEAAAAKELKEKEDLMELARLQVRYNTTTGWEGLFDIIKNIENSPQRSEQSTKDYRFIEDKFYWYDVAED